MYLSGNILRAVYRSLLGIIVTFKVFEVGCLFIVAKNAPTPSSLKADSVGMGILKFPSGQRGGFRRNGVKSEDGVWKNP